MSQTKYEIEFAELGSGVSGENRKKQKRDDETYGKHKRRIEDGVVGAEEAGEFAGGELLV